MEEFSKCNYKCYDIMCESAGNAISDHFAEVSKMLRIGSGAERKVRDCMLTRYAYYLIAQNEDSRKEEIAKRQPLRAVFRDSSFADSPSKINVGEIFKMLAPDTRIKVI